MKKMAAVAVVFGLFCGFGAAAWATTGDSGWQLQGAVSGSTCNFERAQVVTYPFYRVDYNFGSARRNGGPTGCSISNTGSDFVRLLQEGYMIGYVNNQFTVCSQWK